MQIEIVCEPTKQSHRHVRVAVDKTRNDDLAGGIYDFAGSVLLTDFAGPTDGFDASCFDRDGAVIHHATRAIHGYDGSATYN